MNTVLYRISSAATAIVMLAGLLASVIIGGCDALIPCGNAAVPMRCHWAFIATAAVFAIGILAALAQMLSVFSKSKPARLLAAVSTILLAVLAAYLPSPLGIGICSASGMGMPFCGESGMDCHTTAPAVWVCAALLVLIAIIQMLKSNPNAKELPRIDDAGIAD
jgi:hypothetical protein